MRYLKWIIGLIVLLALVVFLNWSSIARLNKVNTMFEPDVIVGNFSDMRTVLFSKDLPARGEAHIWPENTKSLPETVSIAGETRDLSEFLELTHTTALLVIKDGEILFEDYYLGTGQGDQRISWSVAKSFLSALFGIAVENGDIGSLDDPVVQYVPSLGETAYKYATIRNVLNMASGVQFNEDYLDRDSDINKMGRVLALGKSMDDFAHSLKASDRAPGSGRQYVSIDTHVIGMVLRAATGKTIHDYFMDNLWSQIGPGADAYYLTDGEGEPFVLGGLNMRTRDYALFGQLMLQNGMWGSEQVIPSAWIAESTKASAPPDMENTGFDYGYQWWVPEDSHGDYFAVGIYEQYIYIDPASNMIVVKNSANRKFKEPAPSGRSFKHESIDVFRSIVDHYSDGG